MHYYLLHYHKGQIQLLLPLLHDITTITSISHPHNSEMGVHAAEPAENRADALAAAAPVARWTRAVGQTSGPQTGIRVMDSDRRGGAARGPAQSSGSKCRRLVLIGPRISPAVTGVQVWRETSPADRSTPRRLTLSLFNGCRDRSTDVQAHPSPYRIHCTHQRVRAACPVMVSTTGTRFTAPQARWAPGPLGPEPRQQPGPCSGRARDRVRPLLGSGPYAGQARALHPRPT